MVASVLAVPKPDSNQCSFAFFFFLKDTATTEIYPLPLHDALPISEGLVEEAVGEERDVGPPRHRDPVDHGAAHRGGGEARRVADPPTRQHAALRRRRGALPRD